VGHQLAPAGGLRVSAVRVDLGSAAGERYERDDVKVLHDFSLG
jgi:hypothetical protein